MDNKVNTAWVFNKSTKGPEELKLLTLEKPILLESDILIENHAIALNPVDWKVINPNMVGDDGYKVAGVDGAGIVTAVGPKAKVNLGDKVAYHQSLSSHGSYSRYTKVDSKLVFPLENDVDFNIASALMCAGLTAWQTIEKIPVIRDECFIVNGAGSLVGRLVTELALKRGFKVIAIASAEHHTNLRERGVSKLFDYNDKYWKTELNNYLGQKLAYSAVDTVSKKSAESLYPFLDVNSHLVTIQDRIDNNPFPSFDKAISLHEVALNTFHKYFSLREINSLQAGFDYLYKNHKDIIKDRIVIVDFLDIPNALSALKAGKKAKFVASKKEGYKY
ncbi:Zinc-containing alcohol dehydrogenase superfamily protein [Marinomonas sp. MED121]|uniref:alcohol dehydrogenase catalytic domain-containing protein n=1 Tax=Marinomonas sp. MED121 TaxID=314277 RepID=UPI0000691245|nr:zinc-containing alcohol dehydrogenase superfamily protein [Marinomonas sp. MED121]EAQ63529.1 Zinc-containing alcohol dehydrogenase superfamily protein [Marinomonas sp. MED121]